MTTSHTPGRLTVDPAYRSGFVIWGGSHEVPVEVVSSMDEEGRYGAIREEANARRLVACWNRLEKFSTDDIENPEFDLTGYGALLAENIWLKSRNDELLKALKRIEGATMSMYATQLAMLDDLQEIAFAAISKAEGCAEATRKS